MRLSVIIPVFNEAATIGSVLKVVLDRSEVNELVAVDDGSSDGTWEELQRIAAAHPERVRVLRHERNRGKGAALNTGFAAAMGDIVLVQDADLEYDPKEFALLLAPLQNGRADAVYGSRFMGGNPHRILFFWHTIGNKFLTFLSNSLTNLNLTDMETCYKMIRTPIAQGLTLKENRFGFEPEITARLSRVPGIRLYEVGISYYGRTYDEGKKINWRDGFRAIYCILKYNLWDR
jgi:glycosyltransferase involved in cell wall biosynthesis